MSGTKLLLDTNIVLYLLNGDETIVDLIDDKEIYVSFITELELLSYQEITENEQMKIDQFLSDCTIVNLTKKIKVNTINLRRKHKVKLPDSIIAATSEYLNIPLITSDTGFKKIESINTVIYEY